METWEEWTSSQLELWGEEHLPTIRSILAKLESIGIYYQDPNPYNIRADWSPPLPD